MKNGKARFHLVFCLPFVVTRCSISLLMSQFILHDMSMTLKMNISELLSKKTVRSTQRTLFRNSYVIDLDDLRASIKTFLVNI